MNIRHRLGLGIGVATAWFGVVAPHCADRIHQATLEAPPPFSVAHVRDRLRSSDDTGETEGDEAVAAALSRLSTLELAEEERVMAMWNLLDDETIATTKAQLSQLPPLLHAVDPRFFEPVNPALISRIIEVYGFQPAVLGPALSLKRPINLDHRAQLMLMLSGAHHRLLSADQAALLLGGALELLDLQSARMEGEAQLKTLMDESSTN